MVPKLLDVFGAADPHQLQALEVGAVGQQYVGDMIGFIARQGEANGEREFCHRFADRLGVPERDRRIDAVDQPYVGWRCMREFVEILLLHHPGEMRRPERLAPGRIGDQRHQRAMRAARARARNPLVLTRRVHRIVHEPVGARRDARPAIIGRPVEPHGGAKRAARHVERAEQAGNQRARPAALVAAPAIVDGLAERDGDRPERQRDAFDLDRLADMGMGKELVGDAADAGSRHVADRRRPFRRIGLHVGD